MTLQGDDMRRDADGYLTGRRLGESSGKPPRTYPKGRRCPCGARLSVFNPEPVCAPCSGERWADH